MVTFLDNLLRNTLDFPSDQWLGIERAHRALTVKPNNPDKPRSIVVKFGSYRIKGEVVQSLAEERGVFLKEHISLWITITLLRPLKDVMNTEKRRRFS